MLTWMDVIADKSLQDLPYKIELNRYGKIEMRPASNMHALLQGELQQLIKNVLPGGVTIPECSVQTTNGVRVPDVAWCSYRFFAEQQVRTPFTVAPEICVEVVSPSNAVAEMREKIALYLEAGAREVWLVDLEGNIRFHDQGGERPMSGFGEFPLRLELPYLNKH